MTKNGIINLLCLVIMGVSVTVMMGWVLAIPSWETVLPNAVSMKFPTAVCFVCSAFIVFLIHHYFKGHRNLAHTFLPLPCLIIILLMTVIMCAMFLKISTGIENFFVPQDPNAIVTIYPGHPSIVTIVDFLIVTIAGLLTMAELPQLKQYLKVMGVVIGLTGFSGALGYIFNAPLLYYALLWKDHAMAIHTAYLFLFLGIALILLSDESQVKA